MPALSCEIFLLASTQPRQYYQYVDDNRNDMHVTQKTSRFIVNLIVEIVCSICTHNSRQKFRDGGYSHKQGVTQSTIVKNNTQVMPVNIKNPFSLSLAIKLHSYHQIYHTHYACEKRIRQNPVLQKNSLWSIKIIALLS